MVRIKWVGMCSVLRTIPGTPAPFLNLVLSSVSSPSSFQQPSTAKKEWEHPPYLWSQCKTSPSKILVCGVGSQQALVVHTACNRGPGESPAAPHCLQHPHFGLGAYAKSETLSFLLCVLILPKSASRFQQDHVLHPRKVPQNHSPRPRFLGDCPIVAIWGWHLVSVATLMPTKSVTR